MLTNPLVLIHIITDTVFLILLFVALIISFKIVLYWDYTRFDTKQFNLEKSSYLVSTIIKLILYIKIPLFFYYLFTLNYLSSYLPGAMCAAGVATATKVGVFVLMLKIINIYIFSFWITLNQIDLNTKDFRYTKVKFLFAIVIICLFFGEVVLEIINFLDIQPAKLVSCCGSLFNATNNTFASNLLNIPPFIITIILYIEYCLIIINKNLKIIALLSLTFIPIAIIYIIIFLSPYIYELPTHRCPFCLLQKDYYYVGYILYIVLFIATFNGINNYLKKVLNSKTINLKIVKITYTIFIIICTYYPISYWIKNGVWLN